MASQTEGCPSCGGDAYILSHQGDAHLPCPSCYMEQFSKFEPGPEIRCGDKLIESLADVRWLAAELARWIALADQLADALHQQFANPFGVGQYRQTEAALDAWATAQIDGDRMEP